MILRQILSDNTSLQAYLRGELPTEKEVLRALFLAERNTNPALPDYIPRNYRDMYFSGKSSLSAIIGTTYERLSRDHLEVSGNAVHVRPEVFTKWQVLLTWMPPLPLVAFAIQKQWRLSELRRPDLLRDYIEDYILPNSGFTALPTPLLPDLQALLRDEQGLSDIHIHLNGTTEVDHVWLHSLENPFDYYQEQRNILQSEELALEQFQQLEPGLTPKMVYDRLRLAGWLRHRMVEHLFVGESLCLADLEKVLPLSAFPFSRNDFNILRKHPLRAVLGRLGGNFNSMQLESLFYVAAFQRLEQSIEGKSIFTAMFHCYLLLLGFFNKLVVQQATQCGFDQFQKITVNEARSASEKHYERRFRQIMGNSRNHLAFIEGRFSPKESVAKNRKLLATIIAGFNSVKKNTALEDDSLSGLKPELRLVAHFIKKPDSDGATELKVRHHVLRLDLDRRANALLAARDSDHNIREYLTGIDAASNEMDAGPEVFAPLYRLFRRRGFTHFTFHAGEDYIHLVSGIRLVYEAVQFLELRQGDRIGHATAVGIDPDLWLQRCGGHLVMSKQQWLDDLLFAHSLLIRSFDPIVSKLEEKINLLSCQIYQEALPIAIHKRALELRCLDPMISFDYSGAKQSDKLIFEDQIEWSSVDKARNECALAFGLFQKYHGKECCDRGKELTETDDIFTAETLLKLQQATLAELYDKGIVIESMPTSNVRISYYQNHKEHHIWRWLGADRDSSFANEKRPIICIGSDDPGIFATNIVNEYAHVYQGLVTDYAQSRVDAANVLRQLAQNGRSYRFVNP